MAKTNKTKANNEAEQQKTEQAAEATAADAKAAAAEEAVTGSEQQAAEETEQQKEPKELTKLDHTQQFLDTYAEHMAPNRTTAINVMVNMQVAMYQTLKSVLSEEDDKMFKACFDLVNKVFANNATGAFGAAYVFRHLSEWPMSERSLKSLVNLVDMLLLLSDPKKRKENKARINIDKCLDQEVTDLTDQEVANVRKYYNFR